ncbi:MULTISPECIES: cytidine deaminase [Pseudomonas]|uniref:Cytidine deaminase n=1 Tax=Pseudomonas luteola TaxID=47886 RepID=A0A2X2D379_PSELU|nr:MULTISPECIES: cytidine deaminase [Pseudomonas]ENA32926.1 cytidine deaminase [Pseudomonas sp. HPB0071]MBF8643315.1 cytidine deaminase [Pseudomonas zeshuii]RRW42558.1 cytidine deaminase [Pseudomonas luteola]SHJ52755.1 cytidine deaminase [Pseudomonas zeshuii]SPZ13381.1 Cytidine deaminase [Pseudomonas luteola]
MSEHAATEHEQLLEEAKLAADQTYSPYSQFPVGAALLTENGRVIRGVNVENISYGLTNCAERSALFSAISQGFAPRSFKAIAVYAPKVPLISPCGACRQVLLELMAPDAVIICQGSDALATKVWTLKELLPGAFDSF